MKKIPSGYRLSGASQERHGGSIYCSAWSKDLYECTTPTTVSCTGDGSNDEHGLDDGQGNRNSKNNDNKHHSPNGEIPPLSSASEKKVKTVLVRCMVTCGGNHVTIYEVGPPCRTNSTTTTADTNNTADVMSEGGTADRGDNPTQYSSSSSGLKVRQTYRDADEEEVFYTCAFGGRSAGTVFGYQPKNDYDMTTITMDRLTCDNNDDGKSSDSIEDTNDDSDSSDDTFTLPKRNRGKFGTRNLKRPRTSASTTTNNGAVTSSPQFKMNNDTAITPTNITDGTSLLSNDDKNADNLTNLSNYNGPQLCCVAGKRAIIKIIDTTQRRLLLTLIGHGDEIYDLKFSPIDPWLLISASKDESLRLWNVQTGTCVVMFAGHEGHCDSVLCAAWHPLGRSIVSSGMDTTVKIWSLEEKDVQCAIKDSYLVKPKSRGRTKHHHSNHVTEDNNGTKHHHGGTGGTGQQHFRSLCQQLPMFSSNKMHTDYVDCVQFVGDLILSKSITNTISLWKPDFTAPLPVATMDSPITPTHHHYHHHKNAAAQVLPLRDFELTNCDIWFVRFQANEDCTMLAAGNCTGEIRVWEIGGSSHHPCRKHLCTLSHLLCTSTVRMVSFSPPLPSIGEDDFRYNGKRREEDSQCLIATCDDGTVWKWDAK